MKCRVSIQLPREIGPGYLLPYGEARSSAVAMEMTVLEAVVTISDIMSKKLAVLLSQLSRVAT